MAMCGVMRIEKRGRGAIYGLQIEANRTRADHDKGRDFSRSDIDWDETENNIHLVQTDNWQKEITRQIHAAGLRERKNSTVLLDGLYTASPGFFDGKTRGQIEAYFKGCLDFHVREYCAGDPSRVINAVIHLDEKTPHMQVASVPIIEDEKGLHLSAKIICGGRQDFRLHQDHFFEQVTREWGLERGEVKDQAEIKAHTTKREWQIATQEERLATAREQTTRAQEAAEEAVRKAEKAQTEADTLATQNEAAREVLKETLNAKGRAAEIHKVFGDKEIVHFHKNVLDDTRHIGDWAYDYLQDAEKAAKQAVEDRQAAEKARRETADLKPEKERARKAAEEAEQYAAKQAKYIKDRARKLAVQAITEAFEGDGTRVDALERARGYMARVKFADGSTVLDHYEAEEREREERLKERAEKRIRKHRDEPER